LARVARERSRTGIYHIMLRGINRQTIFEDNQDRVRFLDTLEEYKDICEFVFYGYCLMDNHVHLLIKETKESVSDIQGEAAPEYIQSCSGVLTVRLFLRMNRIKEKH